MNVKTSDVWVTDELVVNIMSKNYWLFNVMDSKTLVVTVAYLSLVKTTRSSATDFSLARGRPENHPREIKTDELASYCEDLPWAFSTSQVKQYHQQEDTVRNQQKYKRAATSDIP